MDELSMDQKAFEKAIAAYTQKVDGVVQYKVKIKNKQRKTEIIPLVDGISFADYEAEQKYTASLHSGSGIKTVISGVITPDGTFESIKVAAAHYCRSRSWIYTRIQTGEFQIW